jgi:ABC-type sugar transport system substrate-binding protein
MHIAAAVCTTATAAAAAAAAAAKCDRYGLVLQQAAHFYNTVAADMIPSQKPLMLADAVELERVRDVMLR